MSKELEGLLYCFQGKNKKISDTERFRRILMDYILFFEKGIDMILEGKEPEETNSELKERIQKYTLELTEQMEEEERQKYHLQLKKPKRQRFYIAGAGTVEEDMEQTVSEKEDAFGDSENVVLKKKKSYFISEEERNKICRSARSILRITDSLEYALGKSDEGRFSREQLQKVQKDLESVKKSLANTDFVPVAKKLDILVEDMSTKLQKPAKLLVKGENTPIDLERREKISSALVHIIRNAMDHGIEVMEERERLGKSPMGLIKLKFSMEDGKLKVSVSDDGAGIDYQKVLEKAQQKGLLTKLPEEYTKEEIADLILISGFSTAGELSDYSGRGVGMDVVSHNVKVMGGKLKISSEPGMGTKITMKFSKK